MDDMRTVMDAVGVERAPVIAGLAAGLMATVFAAAYPQRVSALVLVDVFPRFERVPGYPWGATGDERDRRIEEFRAGWGKDVRAVLPAIGVPTLVNARGEAARVSPAHSRYVVGQVPGARYVELPGVDTLMWAGDQEATVAEIQEFLTGVRPLEEPDRVLVTVMFTDIVAPTERASQLGDRAWRQTWIATAPWCASNSDGLEGERSIPPATAFLPCSTALDG